MTRSRPTYPAARRAPAGPRRRAVAGILASLLWCVFVLGMFGITRVGGFGKNGQDSLQALFVTSTVVGAIVVFALVSINIVIFTCSGTRRAPPGLVRSAAVLSRFCVARLLLTVAAWLAVVVVDGPSDRFDFIAVAFFTVTDCVLTLFLAGFGRRTVRLLEQSR